MLKRLPPEFWLKAMLGIIGVACTISAIGWQVSLRFSDVSRDIGDVKTSQARIEAKLDAHLDAHSKPVSYSKPVAKQEL